MHLYETANERHFSKSISLSFKIIRRESNCQLMLGTYWCVLSIPFGATLSSSSWPKMLLRKPFGSGFGWPKWRTNSGTEITLRRGAELCWMLFLVKNMEISSDNGWRILSWGLPDNSKAVLGGTPGTSCNQAFASWLDWIGMRSAGDTMLRNDMRHLLHLSHGYPIRIRGCRVENQENTNIWSM